MNFESVFKELNDSFSESHEIQVGNHIFVLKPHSTPLVYDKVRQDFDSQLITSAEYYARTAALAVTAIDGEEVPPVVITKVEGSPDVKRTRYEFLYTFFAKTPREISYSIAIAYLSMIGDINKKISEAVSSSYITKFKNEIEAATLSIDKTLLEDANSVGDSPNVDLSDIMPAEAVQSLGDKLGGAQPATQAPVDSK